MYRCREERGPGITGAGSISILLRTAVTTLLMPKLNMLAPRLPTR